MSSTFLPGPFTATGGEWTRKAGREASDTASTTKTRAPAGQAGEGAG
ncbi:MAG: hypothetical protein R3C09_20895 [Pirellulaceae bacterium]